MPKWASPAAGAVVVLAAFAHGLTKTTDPDAWTHLALGREMVQRGGFPALEPLTYPSTAMPYYNTEWLFDLAMYFTYLGAGFAGVTLLKAALIAAVFAILWRDSRAAGVEAPNWLSLVIRVATLLPIILLARYRFIERPDLFMLIFLALTIYGLNSYLARGSRSLYLLPAVQVLWVNIHPSVIVGVVPYVAVLIGGGLQRLLDQRRGTTSATTPSPRQLRTVALVFAACLLASMLNPYGADPLMLPFRLADMSWFRTNVVELQPAGLTHFPVALGALLLVSFALNVRRLSIIDVLLVLPFAYLGSAGIRFVVLFVVVAGPILARNLCQVATRWLSERWRRVGYGAALATASLGLMAVGLSLGRVAPLADPWLVPGFGVNERFVPEGASRYLDRIGLRGRVFNRFHLGGYIAWRDFPRRVPIVDGRGYVPAGLLERIQFAPQNPTVLAELQAEYDFEAAIVDYPRHRGTGPDEADSDADLAINSEGWALVYWDDAAMVYLPRIERLAPVIARDEYRAVRPANGPTFLARALADRGRLPEIEAELRRNIAETGSATAYTLLGYVALEVGAYDTAIAALAQVTDERRRMHAYRGLALAYWKKGDFARAVDYYQNIISVEEDAGSLYNAGLALAQMGDVGAAVNLLERSRRLDPAFPLVYPALIGAYQRLGRTAAAGELEPAATAAVARARADGHIRRALALRNQRRTAEAMAELNESLRLDPGNARALRHLGELSLAEGRLDVAQSQLTAALAADASLARAHYSLALVYRSQGDHGAARRHFERYVELEPRSYQAWQAREELRRLRR